MCVCVRKRERERERERWDRVKDKGIKGIASRIQLFHFILYIRLYYVNDTK